MSTIDLIFSYYDKLILSFTPAQQAGISFVVLLFLIWQIYLFVKSGHWIFVAVIIILMPSTWPALRNVVSYIWIIIKFLLERAQNVI